MDGRAVQRIAEGSANDAGHDPRDEQIRTLRRDIDALRRENRILKIAVAELERVADRDTLTPLYNRRFFITALHQRIARVARYDECATLLYIDINQLKAVNDAHGHAAGDFVLMEIAKRLMGAIRSTDIAARIGGDEFGLILDQMNADHARRQIDRFAALLRDNPIEFDGQVMTISACFGVATLLGDMTEADVLAEADRDLHRAKAAARAAS